MKTNTTKPDPRANQYRHIHFCPAREEYCLTLPGGHVSYHDSAASAVRTRESLERGPQIIERAALTPDRMGYMNIERRKAQ
jgi:hypothetical protein